MTKKNKAQTLEERFLDAVECYWSSDRPARIEVYPDPKVDRCFAFRTFQKDGTEYRWLVCYFRNEWTTQDIADNLEEMEIKDEDGGEMPWPPLSGELRFF